VAAVVVCGCLGALYFNDSFVEVAAASFVDLNRDASLLKNKVFEIKNLIVKITWKIISKAFGN